MDVRRPNIAATLDGAALENIAAVTVSRAIGGDNGQATITTAEAATFGVGGSVAVALGFGGASDVVFIGFVSQAGGAVPSSGELTARDRLGRMRLPWGGSARVYRTQGTVEHTAATIIRNLLEAYAIASTFASIEEDDIGTLGVIQPVRLNQGDVPRNLINDLDRNAGYATFTRGNGSIYRRPLELGSASVTFTEGVNIVSARRTVSDDGIENSAIITGLTFEGTAVSGTASVSNGDVPDPPGVVAKEFTSNYLETPGAAGTAAARHVAVYGGTPDEVEITVAGTTDVDLGDTFAVTAASLGCSGRAYFCVSVSHSAGSSGWTTTLRGRRYG